MFYIYQPGAKNVNHVCGLGRERLLIQQTRGGAVPAQQLHGEVPVISAVGEERVEVVRGEINGGLEGFDDGVVQDKADWGERGGERVRVRGRLLHLGRGGERRDRSSVLVPGRGVLDLRRQDQARLRRLRRPVRRLLPRRRTDGGRLLAHLRLLPHLRLRHLHPQRGRTLLTKMPFLNIYHICLCLCFLLPGSELCCFNKF